MHIFVVFWCSLTVAFHVAVRYRSAESRRASWKLADVLGQSESNSQGTIHATFDLASSQSPSSGAAPIMAAVQFSADGSTLSGIDFELAGPGYRVSLVKKRFSAGK